MEKLYPHVIEDPSVHILHAIIDRFVPIGRYKFLWDIHYPLGAIDLHASDSPLEIVLSTVTYVQPGHTEEYGEKIVSQFAFQSFHALLLGMKNINGILARPLLQIEYNRKILLSIRPSGKKFTEAFQQITANVLQKYTRGGEYLKKAHVDVTVKAKELAQLNLWDAAKKRQTTPQPPRYSEAAQRDFLRRIRAA